MTRNLLGESVTTQPSGRIAGPSCPGIEWTAGSSAATFPAMTDDELIALEHENWIAYLTGVVRCTSGADVIRVGGVVAILTGLPFDWFNQVLVEHEEATRDGVLAGGGPSARAG